MKIGELASSTALNASAIRYYEKLGLLAAPYRIAGQRRYLDDAVYRVLLIRFGEIDHQSDTACFPGIGYIALFFAAETESTAIVSPLTLPFTVALIPASLSSSASCPSSV